MKREILTVVGITILFLGMSITPVIAIINTNENPMSNTSLKSSFEGGKETTIGIKADNNIVKKDIEYDCGPKIDSNIRLTSKHLTLFRKTINHIDELQIKEFIQQLINSLEVNNYVDSKDIEEIVKSLNLNEKIKGIYFLCLLRSNGIGTAYSRGIFPLILEFVFYYLFNDEIHIGPAFLVDWYSYEGDTYINSRKIYDDDSQKGYIFGFLGMTFSGGIWPCIYNVIGFSDLVIITDYDTIN
ncbi:MAG: hypothetical protein JSU91_07185 [Thermoplasmatales archaeon]|nr:MAG: hypothetical protein JSU91_07185 [Thermoplasmatales archaeon]